MIDTSSSLIREVGKMDGYREAAGKEEGLIGEAWRTKLNSAHTIAALI